MAPADDAEKAEMREAITTETFHDPEKMYAGLHSSEIAVSIFQKDYHGTTDMDSAPLPRRCRDGETFYACFSRDEKNYMSATKHNWTKFLFYLPTHIPDEKTKDLSPDEKKAAQKLVKDLYQDFRERPAGPRQFAQWFKARNLDRVVDISLL